MFGDLRYAVRTLARSPGYTVVGILTLVLGLGANTAVFSLINGVLLQPLPFPQPDRLVRVAEVNGRGGEMQVAWANFEDFRARTRTVENLVATNGGYESTVLGTGQPLRVVTAAVSEGFLGTIGVVPAFGRDFLRDEHRVGAAPAVIVSDGFWRTHLAGTQDLGSRNLTVAGRMSRVVGVMPPGFDFPRNADVWYPVELDEQSPSRTSHNYTVIGRLRTGATAEQTRTELDGIVRAIIAENPSAANATGFTDYFPHATAVVSLHEATVGSMRRPLYVLLGASLLVLLVACTNLASTALARGTGREREYAIRHALGAGRSRLVRIHFAETLVLALTGAALCFLVAGLALQLLPALAPAGMPRMDEVRLDPFAIVFTVIVALGVATLAGVGPGVRIAHHAATSLRSGGRGGDGPRRQRIWKWLVAAEMALALLLLVASGLLVRSFWTVLRVEAGFRTEHVLTATVNPPSSKYGDNETKRRYYGELLARLQNISGAEHVGLMLSAPMRSVSNGLITTRAGARADITADYQVVAGDAFAALGMPVLRGRTFDRTDRADVAHSVVINRALADEIWPNEDPVGKQLTGGGMDDFWDDPDAFATVIGVVGDVRQRDLASAPRPTIYFDVRQRPFRAWSMTAILQPRSGVPYTGLAADVRAAVADIDADVPVTIASMEDRVADTLAPRRFILLVILAFAGVALALASVGVYGVVSYAVERRRREIGIRLALGAQPQGVRRRIQRDYLGPAAAGALAGVALALVVTRVLASLLYEVTPTDPLTFIGVLLVLGAAAWAASFVPALRSTRVSPLETMRAD